MCLEIASARFVKVQTVAFRRMNKGTCHRHDSGYSGGSENQTAAVELPLIRTANQWWTPPIVLSCCQQDDVDVPAPDEGVNFTDIPYVAPANDNSPLKIDYQPASVFRFVV